MRFEVHLHRRKDVGKMKIEKLQLIFVNESYSKTRLWNLMVFFFKRGGPSYFRRVEDLSASVEIFKSCQV